MGHKLFKFILHVDHKSIVHKFMDDKLFIYTSLNVPERIF